MSSITVIPLETQKHVEEAQQLNFWEDYVDWRKRPAVKGRHGGMLAASFVLVVEVLENLAFLANASNLVLYLSKFMHYSPSDSANIVTNFMGTAFLLALLGGFLADAFFTTYSIFLISAAIESSGLLILMLQAHVQYLKPPRCVSNQLGSPCHKVGGGEAVMLFAGLYLVALGVGGIKGSLPPHGAEQFDETTFEGRKKRSAFFNYFIFCLSCGALIAVTLVVWMEDNKGWQWGFGISTLTIIISIPVFLFGSPTYRIKTPAGSPITTIFKVLASAAFNSRQAKSCNGVVMNISTTSVCSDSSRGREIDEQRQSMEMEKNNNPTPVPVPVPVPVSVAVPTQGLEFLNKAAISNPNHPQLKCTVKQVEEAKVVLKIFPIFASTIMLNCCLAQLSTFSVQQAATMNTKLGSLKVPPASLPVFPVLFIMILAPTYNHVIVPIARKLTKSEMGIPHLKRIGTGLVLSTVAMAVAALVEMKRKSVAPKTDMLDSPDPLPITFLWVALQYLFLGSADLFSLAGMMEFFFTEAPMSMRSLATALSWASLAMGYYFSSVLVTLVNGITKACGRTPWLSGRSLNHYHLERFYWLMCILSGLNLLQYLFWASRYTYRSTRGREQSFKEEQHKSDLLV